MLWLYGTAGFGKSVLAAYLSEAIAQEYTAMSIAYFFCKEEITLLNEAHHLIRTFIHQITVRNALETRNLAQAVRACSASIANCTASTNEFVDFFVMPELQYDLYSTPRRR